jgi:alpha-methylacyl-CoA racemase
LRHAESSGEGCHLDISMSDNIFAWQYTAMAMQHAGTPAKPGAELNTGGSPRYQVYRTSDDRFIAAAPMEQVFWNNFCEVIGLPAPYRDDSADPAGCIDAVRTIMASRTEKQWLAAFAGRDVCCSPVNDVGAAMSDPHFRARGLFEAVVTSAGHSMPALPVPLAPVFRQSPRAVPSPRYEPTPDTDSGAGWA